MFDPEKSRLILEPLISLNPDLKLQAGEGSRSNRAEMLWRSVNETAKRQAEDGSPAAAMEWLATLPFASASDYARVVGDVFRVWILKSETDATARLQNARLDPALKAGLLAPAKP